MLTLLGSLLGFGTSALPSIMGYFTDKRDQKHELAVMDKQMESQRLAGEQKVQEVSIDADIRSFEAAHKGYDRPPVNKFWEGARASVRPVVTYLFMSLFIFVEVCLIVKAMQTGMNLVDTAALVWDDDNKAIFATILTFWFGGRMFGKKNA